MSLARLRNISLTSNGSNTYRGRRRDSYAPLDRAELVELRARMRTFDQAYIRTALMNLGYSVVIIKLFDNRFHRIGLLFAVLGAVLYICALLRRKHSNLDFADDVVPDSARTPISPVGTNSSGRRIFGRPFRTAGNVVVLVSLLVASMHIALFGLLWEL
ncbi:hypothetical protein M408DRAFT_319869 [Serendipita vermifera MAFF 305830]|uniref:DUF202 domain-containing protein n=1 Tax=Serendipita vermifera MAFF 305830 TaxID=933852 RepID=A0A0C3AU91_SERVB|nr:hypothetical protein M408DRAFT_319869 [Serendipita vermifera MAFF 305830]